MIGLVLAAALFVPGPDDPVCEVGQVPAVDHCAQGQLPEETIGRELDPVPVPGTASIPGSGIGDPAGVPVLAHTGLVETRYLQGSAALIVAGAALRLVAGRLRAAR